jgi:DNA-binding CsgD family transcriptional regulator
VNAGVVSRPLEGRAVTEFLQAAAERPSGLIVGGEAGIGKTTLWLAALEQARKRGFRVLSAAVGHTESVLAYAAIADLLRDVDAAVPAELPDVQRVAVDHVLLRAGRNDPATDHHVVAAAFSSIVHRLAGDGPLLIAIDDVQWLDASSQSVVAFAARRLTGQVGVLVTERTDPDAGTAGRWLQMVRPDSINQIQVGPLSLGGLHVMISARLERSFPRPTMVRIAEVSAGNPFYALELAREIDAGAGDQPRLPPTLAELMHLRIGRLDRDTRDMLLAAAAVADPTVELLARVTNTTADQAVELLGEAENKGLIAIDGNNVRFAHPLLARCVYTDASPARRRAVHRFLADGLLPPELKARHMALAASSADPETLHALDSAAESARARGAPAAAAELVELAIGLGGDTPPRRIIASQHHLRAGDIHKAHALLERDAERLPAGLDRAKALNLLAAMHIHGDSFVRAAALLEQALADVGNDREVEVNTLLLLSHARLNSGEFDEALNAAERAMTVADAADAPDLKSQVLATRAMVGCMCGHGIDEAALKRALELEDPESDAPFALRASANNAQLLAWLGRLDEARAQMHAVRQRCVERGAETDLIFVSVFTAMIEIWRGDFTAAGLVAEETMERAQQLGGDHLRVAGTTVRAAVAAYTGRAADTREAANAAIELARLRGSPRLADWSSISLGFLEVSLGNYAEAVTVLQPLVQRLDLVPGTEIITTAYIPDAAEALIALGRHAEAEPLIKALETNGRRLDRPWMLAIGARCRSMALAANGDVEAAEQMAQQALVEHDRIPMRFERARTLLWLGQLRRRQRQKESAATTLREALGAFEDMGAALWADRARAELGRTNVAPTHDRTLTPAERRVAELAASGMTNRDVAAALFISPKTVEANLSRIYRKLGIKTRAELGRIIGDGR